MASVCACCMVVVKDRLRHVNDSAINLSEHNQAIIPLLLPLIFQNGFLEIMALLFC